MIKKGNRALSVICVAAVIMSGVPVNAANVQERVAQTTQNLAVKAASETVVGEEAGNYVFAATDLEVVERWSTQESTSADGKQIVEFADQYAQIYYRLPDGIDGARIEKIKVDTSSKEFSIKLCADDGSYSDVAFVYGANSLSKGNFVEGVDPSDAKFLCFMNLDTEAATKEIGNVTFTLSSANASGDETSTITPVSVNEATGEYVYNAKDLKVAAEWDATATAGANSLSISYDDKYGQVLVEIPDAIDSSRLRSVTVETANVKTFSVKLCENHDNYQEAGAVYEKEVITDYDLNDDCDKSKIKYVSFMSLAEGTSTREIKTVKFIVAKANASAFDGIESDIPDLKEAIQTQLGDSDFLVGAAISGGDISDDQTMALVKKHFNAVTIGNELKPDATFGYSNNNVPSPHYEDFNGERLYVPTLNFDRGDKMLNAILKWNDEHPENYIKVRGHVLTWHSQTPEWFFHVDYDQNKPYVDTETMTKRHEWYIKSVLEHYCGTNSKYTEMFYGWDVVNEAVSDSSSTYRKDYEDSSWWAVYKSNEFIINAFRFANKYAPKNIELYYNDYNDDVTSKIKGIVQLLKDVKAAEGTRIDGFGMQGHYSTAGGPSKEAFMSAARQYAAVVGKVQLTELDFKASSAYDGTSATYEAENTRLAYRYKEIWEGIQELRADGIDFQGMTVWGLIDRNSWLQTSNSVGGGANGRQKQMPLLFDDDYKAKPAYWTFVNENNLAPQTKTIDILEDEDGYDNAVTLKVGDATVLPTWNNNGINVKFVVPDKTKNSSDEVIVYVEKSGKVNKYEVLRSVAKETANGYEAEINIPYVGKVAGEVKIDFVVVDGDKKYAFNDTTFNQDESSKYFATATFKPFMTIKKGTIKVDGKIDSAWKDASAVPLTINLGSEVSSTAKLLWDENNLYVLATVKDSKLNANSENVYEQDSFEVFIDENNHKSTKYEEDDKQYRVSYEGLQSYNGDKCLEENIQAYVYRTNDGYEMELALKWTDIKPANGTKIGLELQVNDADYSGSRIGTLSWFDTTGQGWDSPAVYGTALLVDGNGTVVEPTQEPTQVPTQEPTVAPTEVPTQEPTVAPTEVPTQEPTVAPTEVPTQEPTVAPTEVPTQEPTVAPTEVPTQEPSTEEPAVDNKVVVIEPSIAIHHKFVTEHAELLAKKDAVLEVTYTAKDYENGWMNLSFISNGDGKYSSALYAVNGGTNTFRVKVSDLLKKMNAANGTDALKYLEVCTWNGTVLDEFKIILSADGNVEEPTTEVPSTEVPKTEEPKTEVPSTEVPKTEEPKTEVPSTEVPVENQSVVLTNVTFGESFDLSSYDYRNIKKIVVKFKGTANQYSGAVVLGDWVDQESFTSDSCKNNTVTLNVKNAHKTLTVYKWWSNTQLDIESVTLLY